MKIKYDESKENLEKILTAIFGSIGTIAILINLSVKGFELENVLDAVKDIASLIVVVAVFLLASRILRRKKKGDFLSVFEDHLKEWAENNKYLIDTTSIENIMGEKVQKRAYFMVLEHSNFVEGIKYASQIGKTGKGAFLYLPIKSEMENQNQRIEFRLNNTTFDKQKKYLTSDGKPNLKLIAEIFSGRINKEFESGLNIHSIPQGETIIVPINNIPKSEESAKKLINLVEFVKTLYLALA